SDRDLDHARYSAGFRALWGVLWYGYGKRPAALADLLGYIGLSADGVERRRGRERKTRRLGAGFDHLTAPRGGGRVESIRLQGEVGTGLLHRWRAAEKRAGECEAQAAARHSHPPSGRESRQCHQLCRGLRAKGRQ